MPRYRSFYVICFFMLTIMLTSASCNGVISKTPNEAVVAAPIESAAPTPAAAESSVKGSDTDFNRGNFIKEVNAAFNFETTSGQKFSDVDRQSPYYLDSMAAAWQGYLKPDANGNARLSEPLSRQEAVDMLDFVVETKTPENWKSDMNASVSKEEAESLISAAKSAYIVTREDKILTFISFDGHDLTGRLSMPAGMKDVKKLIIFVNGSGENTYENRSSSIGWNYRFYDLFSDTFTKNGTAFFSYNTRGVSVTQEKPFMTVDEEAYKTYLPHNQARDIETMVNELKKQDGLADASVYLLGWSEGTVIAPLALLTTGVEVDGLLLAGYLNDNMKDALLYFQYGGADMIPYTTVYFAPKDPNFITEEEYLADPYGAVETYLSGKTFEETDLDSNGIIDKQDFYELYEEDRDNIMAAIGRGDDAWLKENFSPELSSAWLKEHFSLGKTQDMLTQLSLPIYIFHGTSDRRCSVDGVYAVEQAFKDLGKTNLAAYVFEGEDHMLDYADWISDKKLSEGLTKLFEVANELK